MPAARNFFTQGQKESIVEAIKTAELRTSGEIRVHIENKCTGDVLDRAAYVFKKLEMHKTNLRNGVLIYVALKTRVFAIIGDSGINSVVPKDFWDAVKEKMLVRFKDDNYAEGLVKGILMAGAKLSEYFPYHEDDINELPDEISFDKV